MNYFTAPVYYVTDEDGFAPPTFGGAVAVKFGTVAHTNTTPKTLFTLPTNAIVIGIMVNVSTAFTDSGTNLLDIGILGANNHYADNLNVATPGQIVTGMQPARLFTAPLGEPTTVTATFTGQNANAGAGVATVTFLYIVK